MNTNNLLDLIHEYPRTTTAVCALSGTVLPVILARLFGSRYIKTEPVVGDEPVCESLFILHAYKTDSRFENLCEELLNELRNTASSNGLITGRVLKKGLLQAPTGDSTIESKGASYNYCLLLEIREGGDTIKLEADVRYQNFLSGASRISSDKHIAIYNNICRIGYLSRSPKKYYLINFFDSIKPDEFLPTWQKTASWFFKYTSLNNSFLLQKNSGDLGFPFINIAHWDSLVPLIYSIITKPSFDGNVSEEFQAHGLQPNPILWTLLEI